MIDRSSLLIGPCPKQIIGGSSVLAIFVCALFPRTTYSDSEFYADFYDREMMFKASVPERFKFPIKPWDISSVLVVSDVRERFRGGPK